MKITIIVVVFNAAEALAKTLKNASTFRERFDDFIVVDGGSSDGTLSVIGHYFGEGVVTKWLSEPDDGIYDAMNKGWALADDDSHILYLGAGDMLVSLPSFHEKHDCVNTIFYGNVALEGRGIFRAKADWSLVFGNTLHHQALLVPKRLSPRPPFDCSFKTYADFDFNQRLKIAGGKFVFSSEFISFAADGGVSFLLNVREMADVCQKNYGKIIGGLSVIILLLRQARSRLSNG